MTHIDLTGRTGLAIRAYLEPVTGRGEPRPAIVLYDREAAAGRGLFITSYYVSTLLRGRERLERYGLTLPGGIPEWSLSAEEITRLLDWADEAAGHSYVVGLPVVVTVTYSGKVVATIDTVEASAAILEDDVTEDDAEVVGMSAAIVDEAHRAGKIIVRTLTQEV